MDNKETLAQKVFVCADREYSAFIEDMKNHDTGYIVDHAYEIVIMSDLHMIFEEEKLSLPALQELDKLERPLASIYDEWLKNDCGYMEQLRNTVGSFTEKRLSDTAQRYYADPAIPRYEKDFSAAQECDEVHLYHASRRRDVNQT